MNRVRAREGRSWEQIYTEFRELIPHYPTSAIVPTPRLPNPPMLDPKQTFAKQSWTCFCVYRAAIRAVFHASPWKTMTQQGFYRSRNYPIVGKVVPLLLEAQIAPAAWVGYSISAWQRVGTYDRTWDAAPSERKKPAVTIPPIQYVFSGTRVVERAASFAWHAVRYDGGMIAMTSAHITLLAKWERMRRELLRLQPTREEEVVAIVAARFAEGEYERLLEEAKKQCEEQEDDWAQLVRRGVFLWR